MRKKIFKASVETRTSQVNDKKGRSIKRARKFVDLYGICPISLEP
jgi:hypothetical protein